MVPVECFPELIKVIRHDVDHWRSAAIGIVRAFVARASQVVDAWVDHSKTFSHTSDALHLRKTNVRKYAGQSLLGRSSLRSVPRFASTDQATASQDEPGDDGPCQKHYERHRCMLVLHICLKHGIICSFHLTHAEGRKDVILPLYREWIRMPRLVVYDFACGYGLWYGLEAYISFSLDFGPFRASEFALNRFPELFAGTRFCHDKFHQLTHTRCGEPHRLERDGGDKYSFNSSIMEQKNAIIRGLDKTLSNAKLDYALFMIQAVVVGLNELETFDRKDGSRKFTLT